MLRSGNKVFGSGRDASVGIIDSLLREYLANVASGGAGALSCADAQHRTGQNSVCHSHPCQSHLQF